MAKKLIGFDLDGVLIDSQETMKLAWEETTKKLDIRTPFSKYLEGIGKPFEIIVNELGLEKYLPELRNYYFNYTSKYSNLINVFDETVEALHLLNERGLSTAIITSKPREKSQHLLKKFSINSPFLICPEDCSRGKPYPDPLFIVQNNLNLRSDQCLFIGDMISDYLAAKRAGWDFIYASFGYGKVENIDLNICSSPAMLYKYVREQLL